MPGTTSTALTSFSHDQHHETDVAKWKGVNTKIRRPIPRPPEVNKGTWWI